MDEAAIVTRLGDSAWDVCSLVDHARKALRRSTGYPTRDPSAQTELAIKHLMGRGKLAWETGEWLLGDMSDVTALAIHRIATGRKELVKAWLL